MAAVTSFAVPACQDPQANIAGIVSISRAHLDAVPESLLSIAAQQSSAGEVVRLSSWAKPNVAVLQVIARKFGLLISVWLYLVLPTLGSETPLSA